MMNAIRNWFLGPSQGSPVPTPKNKTTSYAERALLQSGESFNRSRSSSNEGTGSLASSWQKVARSRSQDATNGSRRSSETQAKALEQSWQKVELTLEVKKAADKADRPAPTRSASEGRVGFLENFDEIYRIFREDPVKRGPETRVEKALDAATKNPESHLYNVKIDYSFPIDQRALLDKAVPLRSPSSVR